MKQLEDKSVHLSVRGQQKIGGKYLESMGKTFSDQWVLS